MKKVLSIILAVFCISLTFTYADNTKSSQQPKKPIMIFKGKPTVGIERTAQFIDAVLYLDTHIIEMEFDGLGDGEIYIIDQNNQVVESVPVWENQNYAILSAPQNSGTYVLVICCSHYYGEGLFSI